MGKSLNEIAQLLKDKDKKVQLIYAFNGNGKTRLSREFRLLVEPKTDIDTEEIGLASKKIIYYSAFTEDLFYWDNDLENDVDIKLRIQPNSFTGWVLKEQGQDQNVIDNFQKYTNHKLTPKFDLNFTEVTFSFERGNDEHSQNIKISKGEESNFVWSVFYSLLEQVIDVLNIPDPSDRETDKLNQLEYVFIDDPVSSLDDNHLIWLAVNLADLIKMSQSNLKFVITTHNPLFYNVLYNELSRDDKRYSYKAKRDFVKHRLKKLDDGLFLLEEQTSDSPFAYHLYLKKEIEKAVESGQIKKYHFSFLRNILEKTSTFLGYDNWVDLLPLTTDGNSNSYVKRIINLSSHSKHSGDEMAELSDDDKRVLDYLLREIMSTYKFK
ncbi:AAA family ATPase [Paenibacillus polysaccharolyticus]|uniref:AAA family ATPase n=1 Tax=Paenibacillus polysaccharolyticus TaxID=582692 RepID=UPI00203E5222|nr:AAA family ATPase [Paenibacillus polysaccharolyticus]MCM3136250.1 AAA family ATPase [Paenibacillus polysaccharolyticus]